MYRVQKGSSVMALWADRRLSEISAARLTDSAQFLLETSGEQRPTENMSAATGVAGIKKVKKVTKTTKKGDGEASIETTTTTITTESQGTQDGNVRGTGGDFMNGR